MALFRSTAESRLAVSIVPKAPPPDKGQRSSLASSRNRAEDAEIFEAIQAQAPDWQRRVYDEYLPLVRGLVLRSLGPKLDFEDLVADAFVAFFENATNIRSAEGLRSYMVSIVMNVVRRDLRSRRRHSLFFLGDESRKQAERVASPDDPRAKAALIQLSQILNDLDTEDRLTFALCVLEGLKLEEAAQSLGVSISSVKRRLKRATERVERKVQQNPLLADYVQERGARKK